MHEPTISLKNVGFDYRKGFSLGRTQKYSALSDISFELYHGETLGVIGRNGAGKSTLLRILAGIVRPSRGEIHNPGLKVSLLSLNLGLDSQLSGVDNAILSALLLGFTLKDAKKNLQDIIEFSELGNFIHEPVKSYSSGMRTRLGFSIAIHLQPDVLLIDEVLGVGDKEFRQKSNAALKSKINSNQTVVLVSHQDTEIKALCDRVIWVDGGVVRQAGETNSVMDEYEKHILKGRGKAFQPG